ncbi:hypothetical protein MTP03_09740 [Tsukamurella sp. PLM1]|nr:hypothetical protein MTP03_09740 [Tsukamurella sp. PLM1]
MHVHQVHAVARGQRLVHDAGVRAGGEDRGKSVGPQSRQGAQRHDVRVCGARLLSRRREQGDAVPAALEFAPLVVHRVLNPAQRSRVEVGEHRDVQAVSIHTPTITTSDERCEK